MTNDQLSRPHDTIENQVLEIIIYVSQVEKLDKKVFDLHNTIVNLKPTPNSKSSVEDSKQLQSEEDINQLQSKTLEVQDTNNASNKEVEHMIKGETISVPCSETNDNHIAELEGFLSKKKIKVEYLYETCD